MAFLGNTPTTQAFTPAIDFFSGNASTTAFTLSRPVASVAQVEVYVSNVPQTPNTAYTVSGNTITFTSAPPSGTNNIYVYYTSPITQVIAPGQGTVSNTQMTTGAALANIGAGGITPSYLSTGSPSWDSSGNLQFNSGYGSVATAYGCRAWVNFNGTGTVAIRASGNVTSITDNGTGDYTVNFTTAMPDTNYAVFIGKSTDGDQFMGSGTTGPAGPSAYATTSIRIYPQRNSAGTNTDTSIACVSIFR